jgi:hypothetical protein
MPIDVMEVVLEGVYAVPGKQERLVRQIVSGKVFFDQRAEGSQEEWSPGHPVADPPSLQSFAAACLHCSSQPVRHSANDTV